MIPGVSAARHSLEVLGAVVAVIMIPVVHDIARRDQTKVVLVDPTMQLLTTGIAVVTALTQLPDFAAIVDAPWVRSIVHGNLQHCD
jgi:hypothetical protein